MTQHKAFRLLSIFLVTALIFILLGAVLKRAKPELYRQYGEADLVTDQGKRQKLRPGDELPIDEQDAASAAPNERGILSWPDTSILPDYHKVDLSIYRDREDNSKALEGILIFIDAGKSEKLSPETKASGGSQSPTESVDLAPTDPITRLPVSEYNRETMETRQAEEPLIPPDKILETLGGLLGKRLERRGADVIYTRELSPSPQDSAQAAVVGSELLQRFLSELKEQNFRCTPLQDLLPVLSTAMHQPEAAEARLLFTENGVSPKLRLLLDMERQYNDVLLISLRMNEQKKEAPGFTVRYFGGATAANLGSSELHPDRAQDQPAYIGYSTYRRRSFAETLQRRVAGLIKEYPSDNSGKSVVEERSEIGRFCNVVAVEAVVGSSLDSDQLEMLSKEDFLKSLAEAMASGVQLFYQQ